MSLSTGMSLGTDMNEPLELMITQNCVYFVGHQPPPARMHHVTTGSPGTYSPFFPENTSMKARAWVDNDHLLHRTCGPALEYEDGSKRWIIKGLLAGRPR